MRGKADGAFLMSTRDGRIDLKPVDFVAACSTIHCLTTQVPSCFQLPQGGCTCSWNGAFQTPH